MPHWYTEKQVERIVLAARRFVAASLAGEQSVTVGRVTHNPLLGGRCSQFCRECFQAGTNRGEDDTAGLFGATANETARLMRDAGYSIGDTSGLHPGDFLWRPGGQYGHIAIYMGTNEPGHVGQKIIAENTSVAARGVPRRAGTKYTRRGPREQGGFGSWSEVFRLTRHGGGA